MTYAPASTYAAQCAVPRTGINPATATAYADRQGTVALEKSWIRSYINDTYLWYSEVPDISASGYATAVTYFDVLKTSATTASGAPKDKFHFTYTTPEWVALSQSGVSFGYGASWVLLASRPPRSIVVSQVSPGSVAAQAGLVRGTTVQTVDGVDVVNGSDVNALNEGLFPSVSGRAHQFVVTNPGASSTRTVSLTAGPITSVPVQNVKVVSTQGGTVGYMLFNDHIATSETQLIAAVNQLNAAGVTDLVLDVRYNGGGYLDIASELAYMIAGPAKTQGKTFERLTFNDKNPFRLTAADTITPFWDSTQGFSTTQGQSLPYLGLNRVYVLTSPRTCSASESIVNSLRGVGIEVNLIGGTTCGKPYGFIAQDNCGITYFAIQFKGVNDKGFGDYSDGMAPTCKVPDDYTRPLGDPAEGQLAAALTLRATGACPPGTAVALEKAALWAPPAADAGPELILRGNPARENKLRR